MAEFTGIFVATLTPFDDANRLDFGVIRAHTQFLVEAGVNGLSPCGTTGEFLYLSVGEKVRLVAETVAAAKGRIPVMAGVWALTVKEMMLLCRAARDSCASAVFLSPPMSYLGADASI